MAGAVCRAHSVVVAALAPVATTVNATPQAMATPSATAAHRVGAITAVSSQGGYLTGPSEGVGPVRWFRSGQRRERVGDELLELGREELTGRDVESRERSGRVHVAAAVGVVGVGAVRVAVRVTVRVRRGGVVTVGLARRLDPHERDHRVGGAEGLRL